MNIIKKQDDCGCLRGRVKRLIVIVKEKNRECEKLTNRVLELEEIIKKNNLDILPNKILMNTK
jgi:hypothetical protein